MAEEKSWRWLKTVFLKDENRGLGPHCSRTSFENKLVKHSTDKTSETPLCRLCGDCTEKVWHIVSGWRKLVQSEYRKRHDKVALRVHWELCRKYGLECTDRWYDHQPFPVAENNGNEDNLRCDFLYRQAAEADRPNITVVHKDTQQ